MRKSSLTQEPRERSIAALPEEHFRINRKRVLARLLLALYINQHRDAVGPRTDHTASACPRRYRSALPPGGEAERADEGRDVNRAKLRGVVRSELGAMLAETCDSFQGHDEHSFSEINTSETRIRRRCADTAHSLTR